MSIAGTDVTVEHPDYQNKNLASNFSIYFPMPEYLNGLKLKFQVWQTELVK